MHDFKYHTVYQNRSHGNAWRHHTSEGRSIVLEELRDIFSIRNRGECEDSWCKTLIPAAYKIIHQWSVPLSKLTNQLIWLAHICCQSFVMCFLRVKTQDLAPPPVVDLYWYSIWREEVEPLVVSHGSFTASIWVTLTYLRSYTLSSVGKN